MVNNSSLSATATVNASSLGAVAMPVVIIPVDNNCGAIRWLVLEPLRLPS